jgi:hypothetical protein
MTSWLANRCECERCEARRIEHPPKRVGCECPECQPGPGITGSRSALEKNLGVIIKVTQRDYCPVCAGMVTVTACKRGQGWAMVCELGHTWRKYV